MHRDEIARLVQPSLQVDIGTGDITAALLPADKKITATLITRENAALCGVPFVEEVYRQVDPTVELQWQVQEGDAIMPNQTVLTLSGNARSIVTGEREAMNWLQTLSGTATVVSEFIAALNNTNTRLLDTRKTLPGLRAAQKYAVKVGGGDNHRMGLWDAFLIKENHIESCGSIENAVKRARELHPGKPIEVEVENLEQLAQAIAVHVDTVMLDNFTLEDMQHAVTLADKRVKLEASGNVSLDTLREIARTGVDFVSVGALTKHVRAIDFSMRVSA